MLRGETLQGLSGWFARLAGLHGVSYGRSCCSSVFTMRPKRPANRSPYLVADFSLLATILCFC